MTWEEYELRQDPEPDQQQRKRVNPIEYDLGCKAGAWVKTEALITGQE